MMLSRLRAVFLYVSIMVMLSSCYCRYYQGYSSVRFLRGGHGRSLCSDPHGLKDGKKVLATVYTADPFLQQMQFEKQRGDAVSNPGYQKQFTLGIRAETYFLLGKYPCPLLGLGPNYTYSQLQPSYDLQKIFSVERQQQNIRHHRTGLSLNLVTWIRPRMMGYLGLEPAYQWTQTRYRETIPFNTNVSISTQKFNMRLSYGFQFYIRPLIELNLELGYGGGAFVRGGIGFWVF